jgi:3-hydroxybutyryl-CoA dehydrogenase
LDRQIDRGRLPADDGAAIAQRVSVTTELADLGACELLVESVIEDLDTKRQVLLEAEGHVHEAAIIATNTSTLPIIEIARVLKHPDRVVGMHFFNPAPAMGLVEIARPLTTPEAIVTRVADFAYRCGKQGVVVDDRAGFVVNALLFPYLNNAINMLERGTATRDGIDAAMQGGCNFPLGPLALLDLVGLDTSLSILETLYQEFGEPGYSPAPRLRRMVSAGHLGRKSGRGFYDYSSA